MILIDYLEKGKTLNGDYNSDELRRLREEIKAKRRGKLRNKSMLLLQDNAPARTAQVAVDIASEFGFTILPHLPYSLNMAPSDFYLFSRLKDEIRGKRFDNDKHTLNAVEKFLQGVIQNGPRRVSGCLNHVDESILALREVILRDDIASTPLFDSFILRLTTSGTPLV